MPAMKTNTSREQVGVSPFHGAQTFLAAFVVMSAFLWLGSLGCALVTRPDARVDTAEIQTRSRVAVPMASRIEMVGAPEIHARSGIMIDALSGETLFEKKIGRAHV